MSSPENKRSDLSDPLLQMPQGLRSHVVSHISADRIEAWSPYDLSSDGLYVTGYLVLGEDRLAHFTGEGGKWRTEWVDLDEVAEASVVEGVGMSLLRLNNEQAVQAEFRFTNRHAKTMAELHQRLLRRVGDGQAPSEQPEGREESGGPPPGAKALRCEKCDSAIPDWAQVCPRCLKHRKVLSRLLEFVRPYKWRAITGVSLAVVALLVSLLYPKISQWMIDIAIEHRDMRLLVLLASLLAGTFALQAGMGALRGRLMAGLGMRVARNLRDRCYSHMHKLSLGYYSKHTTGTLITRVTRDSDRVWGFVSFNLVEAVMALLTFLGVGVALFVVNWRLALLVLIPIPAMLVLMVVFHRQMHEQFKRIWHRWSAMTAVVADAIPGMRVIKAFGQEDREVERFNLRNDQVYAEESKMLRIFTFFGPTMLFATQIGFLVIWVVGGWWCIRDLPAVRAGAADAGLMTVGKIFAFQAYMMMFNRPIHTVAHMSQMFNRAAVSAQRIFEVLDAEPEIFSRRDARRLPQMAGRIELRNVSFSYDGVRRVLQNIDLVIEPGEMVGLVGKSGSGKTTLVNLICRFYDPIEGQILLDGADIRDWRIEDLRRQIGMVLQEPYLFRGSVAENIAYGNPNADVLSVIEAARAANVHDDIVGFPDGYDTFVGERGHTLSGGERQRVSIARAILNNPRLLILDEATSNVDTETEVRIQAAIDRLVADRTTIAIAHRLSTLRRADRLVVLDRGRIVERGTHAELEARPDGVYARLLAMQADQKSIMALNG